MKYVKESAKRLKKLETIVESLPKKIIVWGTGALTQRLLTNTKLKSKVFLYVNSDSKLWGKELDGVKIISPEELTHYKYPLLVASYRFKDEILKTIKEKKLSNQIITF